MEVCNGGVPRSENIEKLSIHAKVPLITFRLLSFKYDYVTIKWKEKQFPEQGKNGESLLMPGTREGNI